MMGVQAILAFSQCIFMTMYLYNIPLSLTRDDGFGRSLVHIV